MGQGTRHEIRNNLRQTASLLARLSVAGSFVFLAMIVSGRWDITQDTQSPQSLVTPALLAALVEDPGTVEINHWLCPALSSLNLPRLRQVLAGYSHLCPHVLLQVRWPRAAIKKSV